MVYNEKNQEFLELSSWNISTKMKYTILVPFLPKYRHKRNFQEKGFPTF